ncbi:hypothetical protein N7519_008535 [Penicillium mononematosum]|uniref:uncharacterized protein n=1 Tax=Penicillium mononematosum TaxID=268346 RepID=UPI002546FC34|nr:uncharacterized protein N7519_008535 [Penicillium mononematosum]KAJ6178074.1 hypothetical protein N7519_008535 [Penicillium mononematosum]
MPSIPETLTNRSRLSVLSVPKILKSVNSDDKYLKTINKGVISLLKDFITTHRVYKSTYSLPSETKKDKSKRVVNNYIRTLFRVPVLIRYRRNSTIILPNRGSVFSLETKDLFYRLKDVYFTYFNPIVPAGSTL